MRRRRLKKLWRRLHELRNQSQREHQLLLDQLKLRLPEQPTPRILA